MTSHKFPVEVNLLHTKWTSKKSSSNVEISQTWRGVLSHERAWIASIFLLALLYRGLCFAVIGEHPLFHNPVVDAGYHDHWAQRIVAGDVLGHGPDDVFKPPLYAYFLAGWYAVFGRSIALIQWVQSLLGALSCVITAILASRFFGSRVGQIAGLLSALYAPYLFFESQLLTPALSIFLNLTALLVLLPSSRRLSHRRILIGGVLFGCSAGLRPDVLLPMSFIVFYLLWRFRTSSWLVNTGRAACFIVGIVAVILPITIRNAQLTGQFIPISSNAGINFYTGNSAQADGISAVPVGLRWERTVSRVPQPILEQPAHASRWWTARTYEEISANPGSFLVRLGKKSLTFFNGREFRNNIDYHFMQVRAWPLRFPFFQYSLILPLAICGMVFLGRKHDPCIKHDAGSSERLGLILSVLWLAGYWVVGIVFFITARYRMPAVPMLIIPAGWTVVQITSAIHVRQWELLSLYTAVIVTVGILAWPMWFGRPQNDWTRDYVNLGNALRTTGDFSGAEQAYRQALTIQNDPDAQYLLARILFSKKQISQALQYLESARNALPDSPDLLLTSAQGYIAVRNPQQAYKLLYQLLELANHSNLWPKRVEWATAHILLANLEPSAAENHWEQAWSIHPPTTAEASFLRRKDMPRVLKTFRAESQSKPWDWYAQANYGLVLLETGQAGQALTPLRRAAELAPDKDGIRFQLARALAETGSKNEALDILEKLLNRLPESPLHRDVNALYARLTASVN